MRIDQRRLVPSPAGATAASMSIEHAVAVATVERETGRWLERGDLRLEGAGPTRRALLDREVLAFGEWPVGRAFDADDAAGDEPRRPGRRCRRCAAKTSAGGRATVVSMVTAMAISAARPAPV